MTSSLPHEYSHLHLIYLFPWFPRCVTHFFTQWKMCQTRQPSVNFKCLQATVVFFIPWIRMRWMYTIYTITNCGIEWLYVNINSPNDYSNRWYHHRYHWYVTIKWFIWEWFILYLTNITIYTLISSLYDTLFTFRVFSFGETKSKLNMATQDRGCRKRTWYQYNDDSYPIKHHKQYNTPSTPMTIKRRRTFNQSTNNIPINNDSYLYHINKENTKPNKFIYTNLQHQPLKSLTPSSTSSDSNFTFKFDNLYQPNHNKSNSNNLNLIKSIQPRSTRYQFDIHFMQQNCWQK